jgi:predicted acylesterase/phospholipase RssA
MSVVELTRQPGKRQSFKRALALSGGRVTGYLFEIGALAALDDLFEDGVTVNDFDIYMGVSAGAAAAAFMANGVKPAEIFRANLTGERPYYFERRDIFKPAMGEGIMTIPRMVLKLIPFLRFYWRHRHEMSFIDLLDKVQEALPSGLYSLEPFTRYLEATFAAKGLSNSFGGLRKELYIPAIDLESGQEVVFGTENWRQVSIASAVTASSAVPIYFRPVRIADRDYIDAGVGRIAFFEVAVQKGADFLVIINPMIGRQHESGAGPAPPPAGRAARVREKGFLAIGDHVSRLNLETRFSQALRLFQLEHPDKELFVISPKKTDTVLFERSFLSFRDRVQLLQCGYLSAVEVVKEQLGVARSLFARHGMSLSLDRIEQQMAARGGQSAGDGAPPRLDPVACQRKAG